MPGAHGKGFATGGARRALQAVALRLGATLEREIAYRHGPAFLYRHVGLAPLRQAGLRS